MSPKPHLSARAEKLVTEYREIQRLRQSLYAYRIVALVGVILAIVGVAYVIPALATQEAKDDTASVASQAKEVADPILSLCRQGGVVGERLANAGLCGKASEAIKVVRDVAAPQVSVSPHIDYEIVQAAVAQYCSQRNDCRGANGDSPNFNAIVAAVISKIPEPEDGRDGRDGVDGQDATPVSVEQIQDAVNTYCSQESEPCRGAKGATGEPGPAGPEGAAGQNATAPSEATFRRLETGECGLYLRYPDGTELHPMVPAEFCN